MKKYIFLILNFALCVLTSCGSDLEKQVKNAVIPCIKTGITTPSSLKISSIWIGGETENLWDADIKYLEAVERVQLYEKQYKGEKDKALKKSYKESLDYATEQLERLTKWHYSKREYENMTIEPMRAFTVKVTYSYLNIFGTRVENKQYFNVVQFKNLVKNEDGSIKRTFYDCEAHDSDIIHFKTPKI